MPVTIRPNIKSGAADYFFDIHPLYCLRYAISRPFKKLAKNRFESRPQLRFIFVTVIITVLISNKSRQ